MNFCKEINEIREGKLSMNNSYLWDLFLSYYDRMGNLLVPIKPIRIHHYEKTTMYIQGTIQSTSFEIVLPCYNVDIDQLVVQER